ncbi:hypothetical protein B0O80DRAFT_465473 [Mortierella sp. GBAus27b]
MNKAILLPEIIALIGQYLSKQDILVCIRVCRSWKAEFEPRLWRSFTWYHAHSRPSGRSSKRRRPTTDLVRRQAVHIRKLTVELDKQFRAHFLVPKRSQLEELILRPSDACPVIKFKGEAEKMWSNYEKLVRDHQSLRKVVFESNALAIRKSFMATLETCPNLRVLETTKSTLTAASVKVYLRLCSKLTRVSTEMDQFPPGFAFPHGTMTFPKIQYLEIRTPIGLPVRDQMAWISQCPNLKSLIWDPDLSIVVPKFCDMVVKNCVDLTALHLLIDNPDTEIAQIIKSIPRIEKLGLAHTKFGDESMKALERHFPTLRDINLQGCKKVKSPMVQKILASCSSLLSISAETLRYEDAMDQPWVCKNLEMFDIGLSIDTGDPRKHKDQEPETYLGPHQRMFERLSKLTELKYLSVCNSNVPYYVRSTYIRLDLAAGLDQLKTLERLTFFSCKLALFEAVFSDKGFECVEWMVKHWKRLEAIEGTVGIDEDRRAKMDKLLKKYDVKFVQFTIDDDDDDDFWDEDGIVLQEMMYDTYSDGGSVIHYQHHFLHHAFEDEYYDDDDDYYGDDLGYTGLYDDYEESDGTGYYQDYYSLL